jgi:molybdenum cofactor cytidylyltransferase
VTGPPVSGPMPSAVILAGGASTRMGRPKLALPARGEPMLRRVARAALASRCGEVIVVLGGDAETYRPLLDGLDVRVAHNPVPEEGIGSSIRTGVAAVRAGAPGVVVLLADQPFVTVGAIDRLIETADASGRRVVASSFDETIGPPAFFHRDLFPELLALTGDRGARAVIDRHAGDRILVPLDPAAAPDVDTPADLRAMGA